MVRPARLLAVSSAIAVTGVLLAACGSDSDAPAVSQSGTALEGTNWLLDTGALGVDGGDAVTSTIRFESGQASGTNGCNTFTGKYTVDGSKMTIGPVATTQMACPPPADAVGNAVNERLGKVASYAISGEELTLSESNGDALLTYTVSTPTLEGAWNVVSVLYKDAIRSVVPGTELTAEFKADGTVSGSAGCNTFTGGYKVDGTKLTIEQLANTSKLCPDPEGVMEQEAGYIEALQSAATFEQVGDKLTILNSQGQMAVTATKAG